MIPQFLAEVSSNHQRDLQRCFRFIETAARIGCRGVKFQLFRIEQLFAPEILQKSAMHRQRKAWELPLEFLPELAACCRQQQIDFCCTPFYLQAVAQLEPHVDSFKIASYELTWDDLLRECAATAKPLILSTGMADLAEIDHAVEVLRTGGCQDLTLLHCVSGYPAPVADCNLAAIETLRQRYGCPVGWSDHSVSPAVIARAIHRWQAPLVEFHLDLEGAGAEFQTGHCWLPEPMAELIRQTRLALRADGDGRKRPMPAELPDRDWRTDPEDGLRPFKKIRSDYSADS